MIRITSASFIFDFYIYRQNIWHNIKCYSNLNIGWPIRRDIWETLILINVSSTLSDPDCQFEYLDKTRMPKLWVSIGTFAQSQTSKGTVLPSWKDLAEEWRSALCKCWHSWSFLEPYRLFTRLAAWGVTNCLTNASGLLSTGVQVWNLACT